MFGRFVLRGAPLALLALTLTSVSASAITVPAPAPAVRMAKISIPGKPLKAFDISWVGSISAKYCTGDRTNGTIDVIDVLTDKVTAQIGGSEGATGKNLMHSAPTESLCSFTTFRTLSFSDRHGQATVIARSKSLT